jgi:hypothetical protein
MVSLTAHLCIQDVPLAMESASGSVLRLVLEEENAWSRSSRT